MQISFPSFNLFHSSSPSNSSPHPPSRSPSFPGLFGFLSFSSNRYVFFFYVLLTPLTLLFVFQTFYSFFTFFTVLYFPSFQAQLFYLFFSSSNCFCLLSHSSVRPLLSCQTPYSHLHPQSQSPRPPPPTTITLKSLQSVSSPSTISLHLLFKGLSPFPFICLPVSLSSLSSPPLHLSLFQQQRLSEHWKQQQQQRSSFNSNQTLNMVSFFAFHDMTLSFYLIFFLLFLGVTLVTVFFRTT